MKLQNHSLAIARINDGKVLTKFTSANEIIKGFWVTEIDKIKQIFGEGEKLISLTNTPIDF